ncbi:hypothetical protein BG015_001921 [Linnemannia schmuckeri]|uniref:FAD-binding domain-containing protein n=1 Tax=Linnemannia schmuckeri TaxID=64567 RepID=A0A9P5RRM5_9FUNG|nr:hypothetical protein BG015_001921 [Linnemannia schmuckeri]
MVKTRSHKAHMSKEIVSYEQEDSTAALSFGDGTTTRGDIFVGADGAHNAVRKYFIRQ